MENNDCPISDNGNHRYFIFKVVESFEPYTGSYDVLPFKQGKTGTLGSKLYEKVEYALMGCNCGSAIKKLVEQR